MRGGPRVREGHEGNAAKDAVLLGQPGAVGAELDPAFRHGFRNSESASLSLSLAEAVKTYLPVDGSYSRRCSAKSARVFETPALSEGV